MKDIEIGNKILGIDKTIFLCAEVGTTCNGDLQTAKKMIDVAAKAGIDALKFQIIDPEKDFSDPELTYDYRTYNGKIKTEKMVNMLKKYMFTIKEWEEIKEYGDNKGIIIFATPSHLEAVDIMENLNMPAYKICSWNVNFYPLIRKIAKTNKPVIIDSGPASDFEMMRAIDVISKEGNNKIIILYCYHSNNIDEINLNTINYLRNTFNLLTGYSSGGGNADIDFISLAYNPVLIEMRLTLDRRHEGHHHSISMEPEELIQYTKKIKKYEKLIGQPSSSPTKEEKISKNKYFRSLFFDRNMAKGRVISEKDILCKRPALKGIDPFWYDDLIGRKIKKNVKRNEPVTWEIV